MEQLTPAQQRFSQSLIDAWGRPFVPRSKIPEFSSGLYTAKYLSNLDNDPTKDGPPKQIITKIGGRIAYEAEGLAQWFALKVVSS